LPNTEFLRGLKKCSDMELKFTCTGVGQNNENPTYTVHIFYNVVLDQLLLPIISQSFLEWTLTSFEQSLAEFYTMLLEEHHQVALEMLEVEICSSL
jgi:hypothetical protein